MCDVLLVVKEHWKKFWCSCRPLPVPVGAAIASFTSLLRQRNACFVSYIPRSEFRIHHVDNLLLLELLGTNKYEPP